MKAPTGKLAFAYRTISELEAERNQLREELSAERRRAEVSAADANDAEREARELSDRLAAVAAERDQLRADVEALRNRSDLSCDRAYRNGMQRGYAFGSEGDDVGYQRSMALYCDGIHTAMAAKDGQP